jgi:lysozyme family protein
VNASEKFRRCHVVTAKWEGGWSDHPADPGGKTMYGITQAVYHGWLRRKGLPLKAVRLITKTEAEDIYFENYWLPCGGPRLHDGVDLATYDASVNSGVSRGRKWLLAALGGPDHETVKRLCAKRLGFVQSLKIWKNFGRGWARRITDVEAKGVAWALATTASNSTVKKELSQEADKAGKTARNQEIGAGGSGAGGGGAIAAERTSDISDWIVSGFVILAVAVVIFLIVRSRINRERQRAYAREAAKIKANGTET